jgi:hypothetical protein
MWVVPVPQIVSSFVSEGEQMVFTETLAGAGMDKIQPQHLKEWTEQSAVDEAIVRANVESLSSPKEIDYRLNRNNSGKGKTWEGGSGWWVNGVEPDTGEPTYLGGQFKPDAPLVAGTKKDGSPKLRKYISASNQEAAPLFLAHPDRPDYWQQVIDNAREPLIITEGAKKAGAAMSAGFACISLPGVACGQKSDRLRDSVKLFCQEGRRIYLAFDADLLINPDVYRELARLAKLLSAEGAIVYVLLWNPTTKGLDDFLAAHGLDKLRFLVDQAPTWSEWRKTAEASVADTLDSADEVTTGTIDDHIYCRLFGGGNGDFITLNDAFYHYTGKGFWSRLDDRHIYKLIGQQCRRAYRVRRDAKGSVREVTYPFAKDGSMKSAFNFSRSLLDASANLPYNHHLMCFENGVIDLRTGDRHSHDRSHFLTSAIAAPYTPNASCPEVFRSFVETAFGEDLLEVIQAVTSMLLDPTAPYGRFVHLIGPSGSGKGTLLRLWLEMFGMENTRSISSFSELETAEGRHQNLTGVRICALPDVGGYMRGLKPFYELVDNGPMSGRALFSPSAYQTKWSTRFLIASVDHLQIENSGDGWDRRVIPLPSRPRSGKMNPRLSDELSEVKGEIVSWALSISRERRDWVLNNLGLFERIESVRADASVSGDPVRYFVDLCLRPTNSDEKIQNHVLHTWYEAFCVTHGYQRMSMSRFLSHLKTVLAVQFQPRRRALSTEDPDRPRIPAHWTQLEPLDGVFEPVERDVVRCVKSKCKEGGLPAFTDYANSVLNGPGSPGTFEKSGEVPGPSQTLAHQGFQESGPGSPGSPGTFSAVEKSKFLSISTPLVDNDNEFYKRIPPIPGLPGLPGPNSSKTHGCEENGGPGTFEKNGKVPGPNSKCLDQIEPQHPSTSTPPPCTDPDPPHEGRDRDGNYWHNGRRVLDFTDEEFAAYEGEV